MSVLKGICYYLLLFLTIAIVGYAGMQIPMDLGNECVNWIMKILMTLDLEVIVAIVVLLFASFLERFNED